MEKSVCEDCGCKEFYNDDNNITHCVDCGGSEIHYDESVGFGGYHGASSAAIKFYRERADKELNNYDTADTRKTG